MVTVTVVGKKRRLLSMVIGFAIPICVTSVAQYPGKERFHVFTAPKNPGLQTSYPRIQIILSIST